MYCDRCGNQLTLGGQYCTKCGKAVLPGGAATSSATTGQVAGSTGVYAGSTGTYAAPSGAYGERAGMTAGAPARGSERVRRARAAQPPSASDALDDQRNSPAGVGRLDDNLRQDVCPIPQGSMGLAAWRPMGSGLSFSGCFLLAGNCAGALWSTAPGSGVGTV